MFTDSQEIQEIKLTFVTVPNHWEASGSKGAPPSLLLPFLLLWRLASLNSALGGHQALSGGPQMGWGSRYPLRENASQRHPGGLDWVHGWIGSKLLPPGSLP